MEASSRLEKGADLVGVRAGRAWRLVLSRLVQLAAEQLFCLGANRLSIFVCRGAASARSKPEASAFTETACANLPT